MKICPYCAEEIKKEAKKCKHCKEFLEPLLDNDQEKEITENCEDCGEPLTGESAFCGSCGVLQVDSESINARICKDCGASLFGNNVTCNSCGRLSLPDRNSKSEYSNSNSMLGKFSCPKCASQQVGHKKEIGCAVLIIIFVSLGLGLIMIPFLPNYCTCRNCGFRWKN